MILSPLTNASYGNLHNFNAAGINVLKEVNAFKRAKMYSRASSPLAFENLIATQPNYNAFAAVFEINTRADESYLFGTRRQHMFLGRTSITNAGLTTFKTRKDNHFNVNVVNTEQMGDLRDYVTIRTVENKKEMILTQFDFAKLNIKTANELKGHQV